MAAVSAGVLHRGAHARGRGCLPRGRSSEEEEAPKQEEASLSPDNSPGRNMSPELSSVLNNSAFSMQNVLKMKSERDSLSPVNPAANLNVFSTDKLLESTPSYAARREDDERASCPREASPRSCGGETKNSGQQEVSQYHCNEYDVRSVGSAGEEDDKRSVDGGERMVDGRRNVDMDEQSCCSEDTVLSVGNEAQMTNFDSENRTCSTANSQVLSPRSSPVPSPASTIPGHIPNLSSFKHIQSHLSAISQLSQNIHGAPHMLLRPNPIAPNPLMFLNQNRLLFHPHHSLQPQMGPLDSLHPNHPSSLSNSPTSLGNQALPGLSPSEISPNSTISNNQLSPQSPVIEGKLNMMQNLANAGMMQPAPSLRFYKQNLYSGGGPSPQGMQGPYLMQNKDDRLDSRKHNSRSMHHEKMGHQQNVMNPSVMNQNSVGINERLFGSANPLHANITNHHLNNDDDRHNLILNHNGLKFSIDNILKADFGRRITDPLHKRKSTSSKHKFSAAVLNPLSTGSGTVSLGLAAKLLQTSPAVTLKDTGKSSAAFQPSKDSSNNNLFASVKPSGGVGGSAEPKGVPSPEKAASVDLSKAEEEAKSKDGMVWPAWVYCTRYSDRPSSGPRTRRPKKQPGERSPGARDEEKRPRTAFSGPQLARLKHEFAENRYLTERRRQQLSGELGLNEAQIKIWFQNKRAKIKKASGHKNPLALQLMAQGLYNHSTVPLSREEEELQELHAREAGGQ